MKTNSYNPSIIEVELARAIENIKDELQKHLNSNRIVKIENDITEDNPVVKLYLKDDDGDPHEVILKIIQTPDR